MTDVSVREYAPFPSVTGDIVAGAGVKAQTMRDLAVLMNSLAGRGMQLVPFQMFGPPSGFSSGYLAAGSLRFWFRPRYQAVERVWVALVETGGSASKLVCGSAPDVDLGDAFQTSLHMVREPLASQSSTGAEVLVYWGPTGAGTGPRLHALGCWEVPRRLITASTSDRGTIANRFDAGQAVQREDFDNLMAEVDGTSYELGRRVLLNWGTETNLSYSGPPTPLSTSLTTSATYSDLFVVSVPILTRKRLRADTQNEITVKVLAWVDAGTGYIRVSTDSGNTSSAQAVSATTATWYTITIDVDCTDVDSADGRQTAASPGWDGLQVEFKHNGSDTIYVASVSAYEES